MPETVSPRPPRGKLQFRLSTALLVVLLFSVAAVWQRDRIELQKLRQQLEETQRTQAALVDSLTKMELQLSSLELQMNTTTHRDENGILRGSDGRPVGIWGVDGHDLSAETPLVQ